MRKAIVVGFLLLAACAAASSTIVAWPAPDPDHVVRISIHKDAIAQLESLAALTRLTGREQAACATQFGALPVGRGGWIIALIAVGPTLSRYHSDSLNVWWKHQLCAIGAPMVHTHIVPNEVWGRPSNFDTSQARIRREAGDWAPFHILVSVGSKPPSRITIYGLH